MALEVTIAFVFFSSSPVKLAFDSYQDKHVTESGTPLIIIHGLFGSKRNWGSLAKAFSKHGRRVNYYFTVHVSVKFMYVCIHHGKNFET